LRYQKRRRKQQGAAARCGEEVAYNHSMSLRVVRSRDFATAEKPSYAAVESGFSMDRQRLAEGFLHAIFNPKLKKLRPSAWKTG